MSWHYSQALVAASSAGTCSAGEPSAPLSLTPTPAMFWSPGKMTDAFRHSRSGMTCERLTENRGEELLTWFLAASRVRTSAQQEREPESTALGLGCGVRWHELLVKFDPVTCGWKTARCLWEEALDWSCLTLPRWGSLHDGELWERATPVPPISGSGFGCLVGVPTPRSTDGSNGSRTVEGAEREWARGRNKDLGMVVAMWPTPKAHEPGMTAKTTGRGVEKSTHLTTQVALAEGMIDRKTGRLWPTPRAGNPGSRPNGKGGKILAEEVEIAEGMRERGMKLYPTPGANEDSYRLAGNTQQSNSLGAIARREALAESPKSGGQLNPTWVEWLMGWPLGWTDCAVSATDKFRKWCDSHGRR